MKLFELFSTNVIKKQSPNKYSDKINSVDRLKLDRQLIGSEKSGSFGRIHFNKDDLHVVHKFNHKVIEPKNDGYYLYIKHIVDNNIAQENPFAPRVYDIKEITDSTGTGRYKIKLEKLYNSSELDEDQLKVVLHHLFNGADISHAYKKNKDVAERKKRLLYTIGTLLYMAHAKTIKSKNDNLQKLFLVIQRIQKRNSDNVYVAPDFNIGNFMFRLGRSIPQLVIVDPLAGGNY